MQYFSTRNDKNFVSSSKAISQGLSDEGGLFVPETFPSVDLKEIIGKNYSEMASIILQKYLTDYNPEFLDNATKTTYGEAFSGKAGYVKKVVDGLYSLELWHGPTCAFKDYALQLMPKLLVEAKHNLKLTEKTLILVATSGDTGKAALDGYHDIEGIQIAVFYPESGTSEIQRLQMSTQEGDNVGVWAIKGNFDDAQTAVKCVFENKEIAAELDKKNVKLSSANSINWGRLVPQIVYYFASYCELLAKGDIKEGDKIDFCVPTGNFGDILAGYYAKRMGLPVGKLICASNQNNVLTDFFKTGVYNVKRDFHKTSSPSMDILVSSNLERLLYHITNDSALVASYMKTLRQTGEYSVSSEVLAMLQEQFAYGYANETEVANELRAQYETNTYLCDPHSAVAFAVAKDYQKVTGSTTPMVVLSTASPYKFPCSVLESLGHEVPADEFDAFSKLEEITKEPSPAVLASLKTAKERFSQTILPQEILKLVTEL